MALSEHNGVNKDGHNQVHRVQPYAVSNQVRRNAESRILHLCAAISNQVPAKRRIANRNRTAEIRRYHYQDARTSSRRGLAPPA